MKKFTRQKSDESNQSFADRLDSLIAELKDAYSLKVGAAVVSFKGINAELGIKTFAKGLRNEKINY